MLNMTRMFRFTWMWSVLISAISYATRTMSLKEEVPCLEKQLLFPISLPIEQKQPKTIESTTPQTQIIFRGNNAPSPQEIYLSKISEFLPRFLQPQFHKKKLVLDLDETLISSSHKHMSKHDIAVKVYIGGSYSNFFVKKRPHVDHFLETVSQWFELVIFTASLSIYANAVIDKLDPKRHINRRYYRQSCTHKSGSYIKDLQVVCKDLSKVVIIDNSPAAYSINKENGIAIDDYVGNNAQDKSLLNLLPLLEKIRHSEDVRHVLRLQKDINYGGS